MEGQPRKHFIIGDTQVRPGVPVDHLDWVAQAIVDYKPDVIVHLGDHWDHHSLNGHELPGSAPLEGARYADDVFSGNEAFARLNRPIAAEVERLRTGHRKRWEPRKVFIMGNHEIRADRVADNNPRYLGTIGSDKCDTLDWERHPFLKIVIIDDILYCHFLQSPHSSRPIGGSIVNKLGKVGSSFAHGHIQGVDLGTKIMGNGKTLWGLSLGSCYVHLEPYRGAQGQRHFRGCAVFNEVSKGEHCPMLLSLDYLCRRYTGMDIKTYHQRHYPNGDWNHLI